MKRWKSISACFAVLAIWAGSQFADVAAFGLNNRLTGMLRLANVAVAISVPFVAIYLVIVFASFVRADTPKKAS